MNRPNFRPPRIPRLRSLALLACTLALAGAAGPGGDPDYPHGSFRDDCALCHAAESWSPAVISDGLRPRGARLPARGAHQDTPCLLCHVSLEFTETTGSACADCHTDPHLGELGPDCASCHDTDSFARPSDERRAHRATRFPLVGVHASVDCDACHSGEATGFARYANTPMDCWSCHADTWQATTNPDHEAAGFPTDCTRCHTEFGWGGGRFDHSVTGFPLDGAHRLLECSACHVDWNFTGQSADCYSCHQDDYDGTEEPNHVAAGFPTACAQCHDTRDWDSAFDHSATAFPLTGAHVPLVCADCHGGGVYGGLGTACIVCHQADYDGTSDPPHAAAGFPTDCAQCHDTNDWDSAFDHSATAFPLTGAHVPLACADCHGGGVYGGLGTACIVCHQADWDGTSDPNHAAAGFSTDCTECHDTSSWDGSFNHATTAFPLTGAHVPLACADCHGGGVYGGLGTACIVCHQADWDGTSDPNHAAAGFSTDCTECHDTSNWNGSFNHATTAFPLTGAHVPLACADCHGGGVYGGLGTACIVCHQADYDGTTDPDHAAASFSTDCAACHATNAWEGAVFDHDDMFFPIYSGTHRNRWDDCTECHTNSTDYGVFNCLGCHPHSDQSETDGHHRGEGGYAYESSACYSCHPNGRKLMRRPHPASASWLRRLVVVAAVAPALLAGAGPAAAETAKVTYVTGSTVYLDAGTDRGLAGARYAGHSPAGRRARRHARGHGVRVTAGLVLAPRSAPRGPHRRRGTLGVRRRVTAGRTSNSEDEGLPRAARASESLSVREWLRERGLRGRIGVRYAGYSDGTDFGRDWRQPAVDFRLDGKDLGGRPMRRRRRSPLTRARGAPPPMAARTPRGARASTDSLSGGARTAPGGGSMRGASVSTAITSISVFDGVSVETGGDAWRLGAFSGAQPDPITWGWSSDILEHGVWITRRASEGTGAEATRWRVTGGLVGSYTGGTIDREYAVVQGRWLGPRGSVLALQEIDLNRGWKSDVESTVAPTSTYASGRWIATRVLELQGGFDGRRRVRRWRDRITPETEFDDDFRRGVWTGASVRFAADRAPRYDVAAHDRRLRRRRRRLHHDRARFLAAPLGCVDPRPRDPLHERPHGGMAHVRVGRRGDRAARPRGGRPPAGATRPATDSRPAVTRRGSGCDTDFRLARGWYSILSWEKSKGDLEEGTQVRASTSYRF